jgi:hypothetical protein
MTTPNIKFTLVSSLSDENLILELGWAVAEIQQLEATLFNAEYESEEWFDTLNEYRHVIKRVNRLIRARSKGQGSRCVQ